MSAATSSVGDSVAAGVGVGVAVAVAAGRAGVRLLLGLAVLAGVHEMVTEPPIVETGRVSP